MRLQARGKLDLTPSAQDPSQDLSHDEPPPLACFGLQTAAPSTPQPRLCYLWPCNVAAFNHWQRVQTQWREGMGGRSGLDYTAVCSYLRDVCGLKKTALQSMFASLQAMELAALEAWAEQRA